MNRQTIVAHVDNGHFWVVGLLRQQQITQLGGGDPLKRGN